MSFVAVKIFTDWTFSLFAVKSCTIATKHFKIFFYFMSLGKLNTQKRNGGSHLLRYSSNIKSKKSEKTTNVEKTGSVKILFL